MTRKERFVLWLNKLGRGCNRITIIVLYITIMIILGALIYGANQQRTTSNITVSYSRPSYTINFDPAGGGVSLSSKTVKLGDNYGDLPIPTREGYEFAGWSIKEDLDEQKNLVHGFTGSNFMALGRDKMYEDKITIIVKASMDNWADFSAQNMVLISCTESGGWSIEGEERGYFGFWVYDKGVGYKVAFSSIISSSLSSGEHTFMGTFDGQYARLYIDNVLVGTSEKFSSGLIGYHSTNGIFVGMEASTSLTAPYSANYFIGAINYLSIENSVRVNSNEPASLISPTTFTGSNFITLGRNYMYEDRITIIVKASMDNWADFSAQNMTLISCTEGGGWSMCAEDGHLRMYIHDKGVGYKVFNASITSASLSSGEHTFMGTFDGQYARLYIDNVLVGTSSKFSSGLIGYHPTNGIFVGAEAGTNTTTSGGYYFSGTISYVSIERAPIISSEILFEDNDFMTLDRDYMYEDKITITVRASMANWSEVYLQKMVLISCAEKGGWSIAPENASGWCDYITFWIYEKDNNYLNVYSSVKWSSLSSGEHTFMGTFDGEYARLYLDDVLIGTSAKFSSGLIGYNATNVIFVGAEATASATTPNGYYFSGAISYVSIENTVRQPIIVTSTTQKTTMEDQTLTALWRVAQ